MAATEKTGTHTWAEQEAAIGNAKTSAAMLAAIGMTADQVAALSGANAPSGTNVVATMADIPDVPEIPSQANMPTSDQKAALTGTSGTPSASNPYATKATTDTEASARSSGDALALKIASNLSDLNNAATARTNLGLGTAAATDSTAYATAAQGTTADNTASTLISHVSNTSNPHGIAAQVFSEVALTNPYSATTPIVPRRIGDIAINSTSLEIWVSNSGTGATGSWEVAAQGPFGGTLVTDVHAITKNGFYSAVSTASNLPTSDESYYLSALCSNLSTTSAVITAVGLTSGKVWMKRKVSSSWGAWVGGVTSQELAYSIGLTSPIQPQLNNKAALAGSGTQAFSASTAAVGTNTTQVATTAFANASVPVIPWYFTLTATGTGAGVATIQLTCSAPTTITITGGGSFYTDSGGTTGATTTRDLVTGFNTVYVKVASSTSVCKVSQGSFITAINGFISTTNSPYLTYRLAEIPRSVTRAETHGGNIIYGDLAGLPPGLTSLAAGGSTNTVYGDLVDAPKGITDLVIYGVTTASGNLTNLPPGATNVDIAGHNTCVYNTTSGGTRTWDPTAFSVFRINQTGTPSMTSAMGDAWFIDRANKVTAVLGAGTINIPLCTAASATARTYLSGLGYSISTSVV